jgi:chromosome segregation protein
LFLKSLTLKGFKSFADKTTLEFEPGVCVVVGPNGSGKSNIVDSVAWVLGAQGARALRGAKMDDVIFAGTADRPALGRAEVSLTIDNTSHLLPIDFSEVTITRMLFRTGESEYLINGAPCRLLDIQDLLSDTGIGRQQHVIVGQGQLDAVLNARPEERRAIIEEAAGILKFRKRKEKAERRLQATEGNLLRLTDLLREVRRQLRPLERQADAARRHDGIVAELNAVRLHLAGREIEQLRGREAKREATRADLAREEQDVRVRLRALDTEVIEAERALVGPGDDDLADLLARTEALRERSRGLVNLVNERRRGLDRELLAAADEGVVASLVAEAAQLRSELAGLPDDEDATLADAEAVVTAQAEVRSAEAALQAADATARVADAESSRWSARAETLALALDAAHAAAGGEVIAELNGVLGPLVDNVEIAQGAEVAVAAALGDALNAIVVEGGDAARAAVETLKDGAIQALLLVTTANGGAQTTLAPPGTLPLASCVHGLRPGLDAVLARLLAPFVLVEGGWRAALDVALADPGVIAVTREGDRFGGSSPWRAGPLGASAVTPAALADARAQAVESEAAREAAEQEVELARQRLAAARRVELVAVEEDRRIRSERDRADAARETQRSVLATRLAAVEARLAVRPEEEAEARRRRAAVEDRRDAIAAIARRLHGRTEEVEQLAERLRARRRAQSEAARAAGQRLDGLRAERAEAEQRLLEQRERVSRLEIEQTEIRLRLEQAHERVRTDFDCEPDAALAAPAPEVPDGITLHARARELERELRLMGPINPLALSEYEALLERHEFLQNQLDDVRNTRRELARVIKAVDEEIVTVFNAAFEDVARNFSELFAMLFPGGAGRLVLTNPEDALNTGIEMEARPSGKMVRRLSLLSGGERSLAALAYLFSVFRARPSPFYLMDEVEAALDDVNLHRFLDLVHEFRNEAQLLIVSHQKRTMEAADVLYGVSMPPGGSSRVVSQRIHELELEEFPA